MKKSKSLFVLAGLAALALPLAACNTVDTTTEAPLSGAEQEIKAIYDKAVAEGLTDLTYEQWLDSIKGADGKDGAPGAAGADGATIVTGEGAPTAELGKIGDLYLDSATYDLYKKAEAGWAKIGNIKGDAGADGKDYERAKHTVIFNTDGGTVIEDQQIMHGEKIVKPADPEKTGYTFVDWEYEGERWSFPGYVCTSDMTIYANYTANKYNVTFDPGEGTLKPGEDKAEYTFDEQYNLPVPTLLAYTFDGWYDGEVKVNNGRWKIAKDVTLKAKYVAEDYNVTFKYNDATTPDLVEVANADSKNYVSIAAKKPTRAGFEFMGWFDEDGNKVTGNYFADDEGKDRTYTAHWEINPGKYVGQTKAGNPFAVEFIAGGKANVNVDETESFDDWTTGESETLEIKSSDNQGLDYTIVDGQIVIKTKYTNAYGSRTENLVLNVDVANKKVIVAETYELIGGTYGNGRTIAETNTALAKEIKEVADYWAEQPGQYSYEYYDYQYDLDVKDVITLNNGKITLSGNGDMSSNDLSSNTGTYTIKDDVITATFTYYDDAQEPQEVTCTFSVDPTLGSIKCTSSLANGGNMGSIIASNTKFNYVSGPKVA